jgi:hypothetical protein
VFFTRKVQFKRHLALKTGCLREILLIDKNSAAAIERQYVVNHLSDGHLRGVQLNGVIRRFQGSGTA